MHLSLSSGSLLALAAGSSSPNAPAGAEATPIRPTHVRTRSLGGVGESQGGRRGGLGGAAGLSRTRHSLELLLGASLVVWAVRDGRDVATQMHHYLRARLGAAAVAA
jgi:hypothetical protein